MTIRRSFSAAIAVTLLVAVAVAGTGCSGDGVEVTPTTSAATSTPTATPTVDATPVTPTPSPTAAAPEGTATTTPQAGEFGAAAASPVDGQVVVLSRGTDEWLPTEPARDSILTPRGDATWLATAPARSTRFALDGTATGTAEGWNVTESLDGLAHASFLTAPTNQERTLVVVSGGRRFDETVSVETWSRAFSPDGEHLAWVEFVPGTQEGALHLMDLDDGRVTRPAEDLERCRCEAEPPLAWSPSSVYLAYEDSGAGATAVMDVATGEVRIIEGARLAADPWVSLGGAEWLLTIGRDDNAIVLTPADAGSDADPRTLAYPEGATQARIQESLVLVRTEANREHHALVFDPVSGEQLRDLQGEGDIALTADGIATAIITRTELACTGLVVEHPDYQHTLPCDVQSVLWSPGARFLALFPTADGAPVRVLDTRTGAQVEIESPHPEATVTWSGDGEHLLFAWGLD